MKQKEVPLFEEPEYIEEPDRVGADLHLLEIAALADIKALREADQLSIEEKGGTVTFRRPGGEILFSVDVEAVAEMEGRMASFKAFMKRLRKSDRAANGQRSVVVPWKLAIPDDPREKPKHGGH